MKKVLLSGVAAAAMLAFTGVANAQIKIGWPVRGDGRTGEVEIEPRRYEAALGPCVRERVSWFRYPRATDGQVHNVVLPFALEVTEKFGGRH